MLKFVAGMTGDDDQHPDPSLWRRLQRHLAAPRPPIDPSQYEWTEVAPGIRKHLLEDGARNGFRRYLVWIEPDGPIPEHGHDRTEEVLVLEGGLTLDCENDGAYMPGSIFRSRAGHRHHGRAIPGGRCVCHVVEYGTF